MNKNLSLNLMTKRLGIFSPNKPIGEPLYVSPKKEKPENNSVLDPSIEGVQDQKTLLEINGGIFQQDRMIYDKKRSLDRALLYSYQGANVLKIGENEIPKRALINPDKLKQSYDDKIISIGYESKFKAGDVFKWMGTNTYWLIYLQDLTEIAYFRGEIRRCSYEIAWEDEDGEHTTYAAVSGPVETKINYIQKHNISVDTPNFSLTLLIPKNDATIKYFRRYSKFYMQQDELKLCWRVEAVDWISTPGIIEVHATEYYSNEMNDDVEKGIVNALVAKPTNPNTEQVEDIIIGETFIKPKKEYTYIAAVLGDGVWSVDKKYPIQIITDADNPKKIYLKWTSSYSGQFELKFSGYTKTIVVQSLF